MTTQNTDNDEATELSKEDVDFNADVIATAWKEFGDGIPAVAAAALVNEFMPDMTVRANEGVESDRDVLFNDGDILVEEKTMGVCHRQVAKDHAAAYINLERDDARVLAFDMGQVFDRR